MTPLVNYAGCRGERAVSYGKRRAAEMREAMGK